MELLETFWKSFLDNLNLVVAVAAFFLVLHLGHRQAEKYGVSRRALEGLDTWLIVGAILGGRLGGVIPEASLYIDNPLDLIRLNTGLSLYGAIGGGAFALALFGWRRSQSLFVLMDAYSLNLPLGIGLFHLGCLVYGFCGGRPASLPLGIPLPGHFSYRYPSELYEGILAIGLFLVLTRLSPRALSPGSLTGLFLIFYPLIRVLISFTRFSTGPWPWGDQVVSLTFAVVGVTVLLMTRGVGLKRGRSTR